MDDYLDQYFTSSSWSDVNVKERSPWVLSEPDQPNALLPSSPISMIGSNHGMECLATQSTPLVVGPQMNDESLGLQFNAGVHSSGSLKGLQVVADMTTLSRSFNEGGNVICNGGESSEFQRSLTGLETLCSIPQLWHPQPCDGLISSLPMGQTRMQSSCLQGDNGNVDDGNINIFVEIDKFLQLENLSSSINAKVFLSLDQPALFYFVWCLYNNVSGKTSYAKFLLLVFSCQLSDDRYDDRLTISAAGTCNSNSHCFV